LIFQNREEVDHSPKTAATNKWLSKGKLSYTESNRKILLFLHPK